MLHKEQIIQELETLFSEAPPRELRKSLNEVLFRYLMYAADEKADLKELVTDFYLLMDFLEKVEI